MKPDSSVADRIKAELKHLSDPAIARHSQRFFKTGPGEYGEGDRFRGIRVPVLRRLAKSHALASVEDAAQLLESAFHEDRLLALLLLVQQFKKGDAAKRKKIYSLYLKKTDRINNWDLVDSSAEHIVGAYLLERNRAPLYKLVRSESMWERRIAIMSTFCFIRNGDFNDTVELAAYLINDNEDLIHKASGWMIREIGNRDRQCAEAFLKKHYHSMPRTMLRYAIEKFTEKLRKGYLAGTI